MSGKRVSFKRQRKRDEKKNAKTKGRSAGKSTPRCSHHDIEKPTQRAGKLAGNSVGNKHVRQKLVIGLLELKHSTNENRHSYGADASPTRKIKKTAAI